MTIRGTARRCHVNIGAVFNIKHRIQEGNPRHRRTVFGGRKKLSSDRQDRTLLRRLINDPMRSANQLKNVWKDYVICTARPVRNPLRSLGCKSVTPQEVPALTPRMVKQRLSFAEAHHHWRVEDWIKVCFDDESSFQCQTACQAPSVWKLPRRARPQKPVVKYRTKVMIWG